MVQDRRTHVDPVAHVSRLNSDFLAYANHAGRFADFHSCRHLFITSLERAGVRPKVAQTLARHSDIWLTLKRLHAC
jgi:integrase